MPTFTYRYGLRLTMFIAYHALQDSNRRAKPENRPGVSGVDRVTRTYPILAIVSVFFDSSATTMPLRNPGSEWAVLRTNIVLS